MHWIWDGPSWLGHGSNPLYAPVSPSLGEGVWPRVRQFSSAKAIPEEGLQLEMIFHTLLPSCARPVTPSQLAFFIHWLFSGNTYWVPAMDEASLVRESSCNAGDPASIPGSGRSPRGGNGNPFQYSCLENLMDKEEPRGLQSMGMQESGTTKWLTLHFNRGQEFIKHIVEGMCACPVTSVMSDSATPCTVAHQAPLSMGFSRQDYLNGLLCPSTGNLADQGRTHVS